MLDMKTACLMCEAELRADGDAMICSYECSYCVSCADTRNHICDNCKGELVPRPKRIHAE